MLRLRECPFPLLVQSWTPRLEKEAIFGVRARRSCLQIFRRWFWGSKGVLARSFSGDSQPYPWIEFETKASALDHKRFTRIEPEFRRRKRSGKFGGNAEKKSWGQKRWESRKAKGAKGCLNCGEFHSENGRTSHRGGKSFRHMESSPQPTVYEHTAVPRSRRNIPELHRERGKAKSHRARCSSGRRRSSPAFHTRCGSSRLPPTVPSASKGSSEAKGGTNLCSAWPPASEKAQRLRTEFIRATDALSLTSRPRSHSPQRPFRGIS